MYDFRDVTETSEASLLPSEALKINGEYIENQVSGYRTLYVKGREVLSSELTTYETGARDGSTFRSKRYPARTITVGYQLIAASNTAFRDAFNALNAVLNVEEAELIFCDEPDKFLIGTPSEAEDIEPGSNAVVGEFTILCSDPFKYSVEEHEVEPTSDDGTTFVVDYGGTYRSYPTLEADFAEEEESADGSLTGNGDCGFVAFMDENQHIIQLGDPDEADGESFPKSQTLANQVFNAWDSKISSKWKVNAGRLSNLDHTQEGSLKTITVGKTNLLAVNSFGSSSTGWHGPSITRTIPADASGEIGATNWSATWKQLMCMGTEKDASKQKGVFQCHLVNSDDSSNKKIVAGIAVWKGAVGNTAHIRFYVNHKVVGNDIDIDITHYNEYFGYVQTVNGEKIYPVWTSTIKKAGPFITFDIAGIKRGVQSAEIEDMDVHEMTFWFGQWKNQPVLSSNGLYWAKFIKNHCTTYRDIPNKFSANDVVIADCADGSISLNGASAPELGALGNDWENFSLLPGANQIGVAWSDWTSPAPTFKMRYREVFL